MVPVTALGPGEWEAWAGWQQADPRLASPFLSGSFAVVAARHVGAARVASVTEDGSPVAFWPLSLARGAIGPIVPRYTDLQGMVHDPNWSWDWHRILDQIPVAGARFDHLLDYQAESLPGFQMAGSPRVDLAGGWDGYLASLRAGHKNAVTDNARRYRKAGKEFGVEFVPDDRTDEALRVLMMQKSAQCRRNGWVDVFGPARIRRLVEEVARSAEPDLTGHVSTLRFDGAAVAVSLTVQAFGTRCNWFSSYDPAFSWYRPGWTLSFLCLEAAAAEGCRTFSFGKGDDRYKLTFATGTDMVGAGSVPGRGAMGRAFAASRIPDQALKAVFARSPRTEDAMRRGAQELRKLRYKMVSG